jgi:hypothetical protein
MVLKNNSGALADAETSGSDGTGTNRDEGGTRSGSPQLDTDAFSSSSVAGHYSTRLEHNPSSERDDLFNLSRHYQTTAPPALRTYRSAPFTTRGFFSRNEAYAVDQSVNFMDHGRANYSPPVGKARSRTPRNSWVEIFLSQRRGSSSIARTKSQTTEEEEPSIWPKGVVWYFLFLSFGVGATLLTLSVLHLARDPFTGSVRPGEAKRRYQAMQVAVASLGLSQPSELQNLTSSQHYALQWLSASDPAMLAPGDPRFPIRYALATFFYANHPEIAASHSKGAIRHLTSAWPRINKWMSGADVCYWDGIDCEAIGLNNEKELVRWNMTANNLGGTLPPEINVLSKLVSLDFSSNELSGTIPATLYSMPFLKTLILRNNSLTGTISAEIGSSYTAETIDLSKNELRGTLPTSINEAVSLTHLILAQNNLQGTLPEMFRLSKLGELMRILLKSTVRTTNSHLISKLSATINLDNNKFSGRIPLSLMQLSSLGRL